MFNTLGVIPDATALEGVVASGSTVFTAAAALALSILTFKYLRSKIRA